MHWLDQMVDEVGAQGTAAVREEWCDESVSEKHAECFPATAGD